MILFLAEPFGVNPDGDFEAAPIQKQGLEESLSLTISRLTIHKVVSRISAYMLPQMAPPVRHPPSKIPYSCKTNRLMLYIGFS